MAPGTSKLGMAGALGFEPRLSVLETDVLPLTPCPYSNVRHEARRQPIGEAPHPTRHSLASHPLFHLFMRRVLSAELTEFVPFQPIRIVFLVFHGRVIPLFAERTSHVDDFAHFLP